MKLDFHNQMSIMRLEFSCLNYIIYDILMFINLFLGKRWWISSASFKSNLVKITTYSSNKC